MPIIIRDLDPQVEKKEIPVTSVAPIAKGSHLLLVVIVSLLALATALLVRAGL